MDPEVRQGGTVPLNRPIGPPFQFASIPGESSEGCSENASQQERPGEWLRRTPAVETTDRKLDLARLIELLRPRRWGLVVGDLSDSKYLGEAVKTAKLYPRKKASSVSSRRFSLCCGSSVQLEGLQGEKRMPYQY